MQKANYSARPTTSNFLKDRDSSNLCSWCITHIRTEANKLGRPNWSYQVDHTMSTQKFRTGGTKCRYSWVAPFQRFPSVVQDNRRIRHTQLIRRFSITSAIWHARVIPIPLCLHNSRPFNTMTSNKQHAPCSCALFTYNSSTWLRNRPPWNNCPFVSGLSKYQATSPLRNYLHCTRTRPHNLSLQHYDTFFSKLSNGLSADGTFSNRTAHLWWNITPAPSHRRHIRHSPRHVLCRTLRQSYISLLDSSAAVAMKRRQSRVSPRYSIYPSTWHRGSTTTSIVFASLPLPWALLSACFRISSSHFSPAQPHRCPPTAILFQILVPITPETAHRLNITQQHRQTTNQAPILKISDNSDILHTLQSCCTASILS